MKEIYVSTDCETDGPIPGPYSMLSFASAAFLPDKTLLSSFSANLETLPGADAHPDTLAWWQGQPQAWAAARQNARPPEEAMRAYSAWLNALPGRPIFVAFPLAFDFMFVNWYLVRFTGSSPFGHDGIDIKSYAMAVLGLSYSDSGKKYMPGHWFDPHPHTHVALDDAIEQGQLFCNMLIENKKAAA